MKLQSLVRAALIAAIALFSLTSSSAQTRPDPTAAKQKKSMEGRQGGRQEEVARELELTPEQKRKFEQTDKKYDDKIKANRSARNEDMKQLQEERRRAHKALLTREQAAKYDQMIARKDAKRDAQQQKKSGKKQGKAFKKDKPASGKKSSDKFEKKSSDEDKFEKKSSDKDKFGKKSSDKNKSEQE